jgi:hypothetical protein
VCVQISLCIEALITVAIVVAFVVSGVYFLRILKATDRLLSRVELLIPDNNVYQKRVAHSAIGKGRRTRLRIQVVLSLVFSAFTCRAIVESATAYGFVEAQNRREDCGVCSDCQPMSTLFFLWLTNHPEVPIISNVIAAPVALILSVYGTMGQEEQQLLLL